MFSPASWVVSATVFALELLSVYRRHCRCVKC